ncbi:hypothetical protein AURDEDRAFT_167513 [Auricularia subglabra TFB-10046 SS5]|nr:hypothetical protein AURDEDRAFT_167513 [Auricularia subglabra TFB-10046 SS5]
MTYRIRETESIALVAVLMDGYPEFIRGFNAFLPADSQIKCSMPSNEAAAELRVAPPPVETDELREERTLSVALSFVTRVKSFYESEPAVYTHFLRLLQLYQQAKGPEIRVLLDQLAFIFRENEDLVEELKQFISFSG